MDQTTREKLQRLVDKFIKGLPFYETQAYNESQTRSDFIDPLLSLFGWDIDNSKGVSPQLEEVVREHYSDSEPSDRPDYSLRRKGEPVLFVEAKKPAIDLSYDPEPALQARRYGWNAKHNIVVLSNFRQTRIYDSTVKPSPDDDANTALLGSVDFSTGSIEEQYESLKKFIDESFVTSVSFEDETSKIVKDPASTLSVDSSFLLDIEKWRQELANDLMKNNPSKYDSLDDLDYQIQIFLNRLIFLRICEDRDITSRQELLNSVNNCDNPKETLIALFKKADKRFNSGLFAGDGIALDLTNDTMLSIVKSLYYPSSPYLFNIIEPHILGQIYEKFLGTHLIQNKNGSIEIDHNLDSVVKSIVTTPVSIVKFIVQKSLSPLFAGKSFDQISSVRICDICCGSGIFLEEAFSYLCDVAITSWKASGKELNASESFLLKEKILKNCIFGVDIDPKAVEVCRLSLLSKLLEDENQATLSGHEHILPSLSQNIQHGNSLIDPSFLSRRVSNKRYRSLSPFSFTSFGEGTFDAIIGNPPYVKTEDMKNSSKEEYSLYKKYFDSAYRQFDKYFLFVEKGMDLLKLGGSLGLIIPNKFIREDTAVELRKAITASKMNVSIFDFGSAQMFDTRTTYTCVFLGTKKGSGLSIRKTDVESKNEEEWTEGPKTLSLSSKEAEANDWSSFFAKKPQDSFRLLKLTFYADPVNGVQTSAERPPVYWFSSDEVVGKDDSHLFLSRNGKQYNIENALLRPFFKPVTNAEKSLTSYQIPKTNKLIIYPYSEDGVLIPQNQMVKDYPGIWGYLNDNYRLLVPKTVSKKGRRDVPNATKETWYQYGRTQNLTTFNHKDKIIVKNMFNENPLFCFDDSNCILESGGTAGYSAIEMKKDSAMSIDFLQAWLNYPDVVGEIKKLGSDFEGGFHSVGTTTLKKIFVPNVDLFDGHSKKEYELAVASVKLSRKISRDILLCRSESDKEILNRRLIATIKDINNHVKYLFDWSHTK